MNNQLFTLSALLMPEEPQPRTMAEGIEPSDGWLEPCVPRASACAHPHGSEILDSEMVVFSSERSTTE